MLFTSLQMKYYTCFIQALFLCKKYEEALNILETAIIEYPSEIWWVNLNFCFHLEEFGLIMSQIKN